MPRLSQVAFLVLASSLIAPRAPALGCAVARPPGMRVRIANEAAIIVWDEAAGREHFIRRAAFDTTAANFGFLVPTPSKPTLTEVEQRAFDQLTTITAPRIQYVKRSGAVQPSPGCACSVNPGMVKTSAVPNAKAVEVLEEKRIAGQDVAVLAAEEAEALQTWLKEHGYEVSPKLTEWVQPYLDQKWVITAFKFAKPEAGEEQPTLQTSAVCLSFDTERPFYPYREPQAEAQDEELVDDRLLRVFFVGLGEVQATLDTAEIKWPGQIVYAKPLTPEQRVPLFEMLKLEPAKADSDWWLTEFEDASAPRPGIADLYFSPAKDPQEVERPPITVYVSARGFPLDLTFSLVAFGLMVVGLRRFGMHNRSSV